MSKLPKKKFKEMVLDAFDFDVNDFEELHGDLVKYYDSLRKFRRDENGNLVNDWLNGTHLPLRQNPNIIPKKGKKKAEITEVWVEEIVELEEFIPEEINI